jgi:hypothetical protein
MTIGQDLELRRLRHRAERMEAVIAELQHRARSHAARHGAVPPPLRQALGDFRVELRLLRRKIAAGGQDG